MLHLPALIQDLGIILFTAGIVTLVFKKIKQPVVLGYLIAGFLVGPEISFLPTIQERDAIKVWAEIGVIVLLFGLGLEFSFKKLLAVGRGATVTALTEILFMLGVGYLVGQAFNWSVMDSLFLGGILAISSTTIIIRAFDELGMRQKRFVSLVFGVLIVEDLVAILLMVLLSTIAVTKTFEGVQLFESASKLVFFLSIWFLAGIFLVPWFLKRIRKYMNEETTLIVSLGLCLMMVILATHAGFSPALGAFIMGSILAETQDGEKIEHNLRAVRDLFAAIFFVSVGMLIELGPLKEYWLAVVVLTLVTILGKFVSTTAGALLGGQSIKTAVQSGMSLAQIGEFSFIIATLGLSLGVISDFLYPLAVAISAVTTLTTPYMIRASEPFYHWLSLRLPQALLSRAEENAQGLTQNEKVQSSSDALRLFLNSIIVIAIALAGKSYLVPLFDSWGWSESGHLVSAVIAVFLSLPFLWAIGNSSRLNKEGGYRIEDLKNLTSQALLSFISRNILATFLLGFVLAQFISAVLSFTAVIILSMFLGYFGARNFSKIYTWFECRFLANLNAKELEMMKKQNSVPRMAPWNVHLTHLSVHPDSGLIGKSLAEIGVRDQFGIMITMIERGQKIILAPRSNEILMPHDRLALIGEDDHLSHFARVLEPHNGPELESLNSYELVNLPVGEHHPWLGLKLKDANVREKTGGIVVGIERGGQRILNPDPQLQFQKDDSLWIVGDHQKLIDFRQESGGNLS